MACQQCINDCCVRFCVEELLCATDCCGCCHLPTLLAPNLNLQAGTLLGQRTADLRFAPFDPLAVDGTQDLKGILQYHVITDANGNVVHRYFGPFGLGLDCGPLYTNRYVCGIFRTEHLVGDVASAVAAGGLRILEGGVTGPGLVKLV